MPPNNRELVFCHACEDEWFRDVSGLICPNPSCRSDAVEIVCVSNPPSSCLLTSTKIELDNDPRTQTRQSESQAESHTLHDHDLWGTNVPDPDEDIISDSTFRSTAHTQRQHDLPMLPFDSFFDSMLGSRMQRPGTYYGTIPGGHTSRTTTSTGGGGGWSSSSYTFSMSSGPGGTRFARTIGGGPLMRGQENPHDDMFGILGHMFPRQMNPNTPGIDMTNNPNAASALHPLFRLLMGSVPGNQGDVAYTQEGFDRIMTMLRDQHGGADGPPPAAEEAITALPNIKIAKEHLDEQGKAECSICMDGVNIGEEVTMLPCNHWFHGDCIKSWLKEHDTCPQCRRGITPRDGDQNQPRTTGQAPRNWQVNEGDLEGFLTRESRQGGSTSPGGSQSDSYNNAPGSSTRTTSSRGNVVSNIASNIMRRIVGNGSNSNTNSDTGADHPTGSNTRP